MADTVEADVDSIITRLLEGKNYYYINTLIVHNLNIHKI